MTTPTPPKIKDSQSEQPPSLGSVVHSRRKSIVRKASCLEQFNLGILSIGDSIIINSDVASPSEIKVRIKAATTIFHREFRFAPFITNIDFYEIKRTA